MKRALAILTLTLAATNAYANTHVDYTATPQSTGYTKGIQDGCIVGRKFTLDVVSDGTTTKFRTSDISTPRIFVPCTQGKGGSVACDYYMPAMHPGAYPVTIHINVYPDAVTGYTKIGYCTYSMAYGDTLSIARKASEEADREYFKAHPRKPQAKPDFTKW